MSPWPSRFVNECLSVIVYLWSGDIVKPRGGELSFGGPEATRASNVSNIHVTKGFRLHERGDCFFVKPLPIPFSLLTSISGWETSKTENTYFSIKNFTKVNSPEVNFSSL